MSNTDTKGTTMDTFHDGIRAAATEGASIAAHVEASTAARLHREAARRRREADIRRADDDRHCAYFVASDLPATIGSRARREAQDQYDRDLARANARFDAAINDPGTPVVEPQFADRKNKAARDRI